MHEYLFEREIVCKKRKNVKDKAYEEKGVTDPSENSFLLFEQEEGRCYRKWD